MVRSNEWGAYTVGFCLFLLIGVSTLAINACSDPAKKPIEESDASDSGSYSEEPTATLDASETQNDLDASTPPASADSSSVVLDSADDVEQIGIDASDASDEMDATESDAEVDSGDDASDAADNDSEVTGQELNFDSYPILSALQDQPYRYRAITSRPGETVFGLVDAPSGTTIDKNGVVVWTPSSEQAPGSHRFEIAAFQGSESTSQSFSVRTAQLKMVVSKQVVPQNKSTVSVNSPMSNIKGTGLIISEDAIKETATLTIGEAVSSGKVPAADSEGESPKVIDLGPSGKVFSKSIKVVLPLNEQAKQAVSEGQAVAQAWTMNKGGNWKSLPVEHVDLEGGHLVVSTKHFSQFTAIAAPIRIVDPAPRWGGESCPDLLFVSSGLTEDGIDEVEPGWINGIPEGVEATSLADLLAALDTDSHLQWVFSNTLSNDDGSYRQTKTTIVNIYTRSSDTVDVYLTDGAGARFLQVDALAMDSEDLRDLISGEVHHVVFAGVPDPFVGELTVSASAYIRPPQVGEGVPPSSGFPFAESRSAISDIATDGDDQDCDGLNDAYDNTPDGSRPPILSSPDQGTLRTIVDTPVAMTIEVDSEDADPNTPDWSVDDDTGELTVTGDGLSAQFVTETPGAHTVRVAVEDSGGRSEFTFSIIVDVAETSNTAPSCEISAGATTVFVGQAVSLEAVPADDEQSDEELSIQWVADANTLSTIEGRVVSFSATEPAEYLVQCVAHDGIEGGDPGSILISVIERPANTPPQLLYVNPLSATLELPTSDRASATIYATAYDPDDEGVQITFTMIEGDALLTEVDQTPPSNPAEVSAATLFETTIEGPYSILVRARDQRGAYSDTFTVNILVARSIGTTDDDQDGFPAGVDCNDGDATIFPGAFEICGDGIDQSCDGADRSLSDCDGDGDGFSTDMGDCDDTASTVFPGAFERCNGRDDNCDSLTDEGYVVGSACTVGTGACRNSGNIVCSQNGRATVCNATAGQPTAESCNGIDDDCNGVVDDLSDQGTNSLYDCGSCGIACDPAPNQDAFCMPSGDGSYGCQYTCQTGYLDLDNNATNGCEYACTPTGEEICNNQDDNCNGTVDENSTQYYYNGPEGTQGVGICRPGTRVCEDGIPMTAEPDVTPQTELCDGLDNDCDGEIDEDFDLGVACDTDDTDLCALGFTVCTVDQAQTTCSAESAVDLLDICDGQDNDCDPSTIDGAHDPQVGQSCDESNPDFCTPGIADCSNGALVCLNDERVEPDLCGVCFGDNSSCCFCDTTSGCDTDGMGSICTCDWDCNTYCPCDFNAGCDLYDGAFECPCDPECTGQAACGCDQTADLCDIYDNYWLCGCDSDCDLECDCNRSPVACEEDGSGGACYCDDNCYDAGCFCDDADDNHCATDALGHECECDVGCPPPCECDTTDYVCDTDGDSGYCFCDEECFFETCFCGDGNPTTCVTDDLGNPCQCDPGCHSYNMCPCETEPGVCDSQCECDPDCGPPPCDCDNQMDSCESDGAGGECLCDWDCYAIYCYCSDGNPETCSTDAMQNSCKCDKGCDPPCECETEPGVCDTGCFCDPDCGEPYCNCDPEMGVCNDDGSGGNCFCDYDCFGDAGCFCDDFTGGSCPYDAMGNPCDCDPDCGQPYCNCDPEMGVCNDDGSGGDCFCDYDCFGDAGCFCDDFIGGSCPYDAMSNPCDCDPDCGQPYCACDTTTFSCDSASGGGDCFCDNDCYPVCPCDDADDMNCNTDANNNQCNCDIGCEEVCNCDLTPFTCDANGGGQCVCDPDCTDPVCNCEVVQGECDTDDLGGDCYCDKDCYPPCPCDDQNPETCNQDTEGNPCWCDPGCEMPCECNITASVCDSGCFCDPDCMTVESDCNNAFDDDDDGCVDDADVDCGGQEIGYCNDSMDNDCDGLTDCGDFDCSTDPVCS